MTVTTLGGALSDESPRPTLRVDWVLIASVGGAVLCLLTTAAAILADRIDPFLSRSTQQNIAYAVFAAAIFAPTLASWRRAISDHQLPVRNGAEPRYEHVSGWNALFLLAIFALIAWLVSWAAGSDDANRTIHSEWGMWIVIGLSAAFIGVAAAPMLSRLLRLAGFERISSSIGSLLGSPIDRIGRFLSAADGFLVFAVANGVGANRNNILLRYAILLSIIGTCAALGYFWPAPSAFVPIAWGFVVAFSVSRRWAWIEQDRELAMLNPALSQQYIRVGFAQDLRDEALIVFLSMFLLVPLALRQAQLFADSSGLELFSLAGSADVHSLPMWIAYYGTELAKAVPFVDWAEVYHVEGEAPVSANTPLALHAVFTTRVLIDLVFLAALLQAIASASRDAQQQDLFYRKRAIPRLDPFAEPDAFRALVLRNAFGEWVKNPETFDEFPKYDLNRLAELTAHRDERVRRAADLLMTRDGAENDPHYKLSAEAARRGVKAETIQTFLDAIEQAGQQRNVYQLALARRRLTGRTSMNAIRRQMVILITQAPASRDRTEALLSVLLGETREPIFQTRLVALNALEPETGRNLRVRTAIEQLAGSEAKAVKAVAAQILAKYPETPD